MPTSSQHLDSWHRYCAMLNEYQTTFDYADPPLRCCIEENIRYYAFKAQGGFEALRDAALDPHIEQGTMFVSQAIMGSQSYTQILLRKTFSDLNLNLIQNLLWETMKEVALWIGGSAIIGSVEGGIVTGTSGAFSRAAGGTQIGTNILLAIGMPGLTDVMSRYIPEMCEQYASGFAIAWNVRQSDDVFSIGHQQIEIIRAEKYFSAGHVLFAQALFFAIAQFLSSYQVGKSRLIAEITASRLGPQFAGWVDENADKLMQSSTLAIHGNSSGLKV